MSQTKKHCEPLVAVWLRPSTTEPCICCKQVAEKPRGEHLKNDVCMYVFPTHKRNNAKRPLLEVRYRFWELLRIVVNHYVSNFNNFLRFFRLQI